MNKIYIKIKNQFMDRFDFVAFFIRRKRWEMLPIIIILLLIGLLLLAAQSPVIAPLIYTVF